MKRLLFIYSTFFFLTISSISYTQVQVNDTQKTLDRIKYLQNLTDNFIDRNNLDDNALDSTFKVLLKEENITEDHELYYSLGYLSYNKNKYIKAIRLFLWAIESKKEDKNGTFEAEIIFQLAESYRRIFYFEEAIKYYDLLLKEYRLYLNDSRSIRILMNKGSSYLYNDQDEKAKECYQSCYDQTLELHDYEMHAISIINMGNLYIKAKEFTKADSITRRALAICEQYNNTYGAMISRFNLGEINYLTKNYSASKMFFQHALDTKRNKELERLIPEIFKYQALIAFKENNANLSLVYCESFQANISKFSEKNNLIMSIRDINSVLFKLKNNTRAKDILNKNMHLIDSILLLEVEDKKKFTETLKELAKLDISYSSLEKDNSIKDEKLLQTRIITLFVVLVLLLISYFLIVISKSKKVITKHRNRIKEQYDEIKRKSQETEDLNHEIMLQTEEISAQNKLLNNHQKELEKKILERTKKLNLALNKAQESDKLKLAFLQNISHEIRTPLNAIDGFSQLILVDKDNCDKFAEVISQNVSDLLTIIDNIVLYSKLETDQMSSSIQHKAISLIIQELNVHIKQIKKKNERKNIQFKIENLLKEDLSIVTNSILIEKALIQLIDNAYKYTESGTITLKIYKETDTVIFAVIDTGIGIKEDELPYVFESFRKIVDKHKLYRGTGIGLALAKKVVEIFNGEIGIESTFGVGTEIKLKINEDVFSKSIQNE